MEALEGLDAGLLVGADDVGTFIVKTQRIRVGLANTTHIALVLLRVLQLVLGGQPVLALVWAEIPPFRMRSMCLGEIDSTMPR